MHLRARIFACIASSLVLMPAIGIAQDDKKQEQAVQADLPGRVSPAAGRAGWDWNVSTRYVIGDKKHEGKATCEAKMILGGRFLQQDYSSLFQGSRSMCCSSGATTTSRRSRSRS